MGRKKAGKIVNFSTYSGYTNSDITTKKEKKVKKERRKLFNGKFIIFLLLLISLICVCLFTPAFNITQITVKYNGIENVDKNVVIQETDNAQEQVEELEDNQQEINGGNSVPYTNQEIIDMSQIVIGTNIFRANTNSVIDKILAAPYVKSVKVTRKLPSTMVIDIEQRYVKAYVDYIGSYMCIDETGFCIDSIQKPDKVDGIPIITGLSPKDMVKGFAIGEILDVDDPVKIQKYTNLFELLQKNELNLDIEKIDLSNTGNTIILIENQNKIIEFGNMENVNAKIPFLKKILEVEVDKKGTIYMNKTSDPIFSEKVGG